MGEKENENKGKERKLKRTGDRRRNREKRIYKKVGNEEGGREGKKKKWDGNGFSQNIYVFYTTLAIKRFLMGENKFSFL